MKTACDAHWCMSHSDIILDRLCGDFITKQQHNSLFPACRGFDLVLRFTCSIKLNKIVLS